MSGDYPLGADCDTDAMRDAALRRYAAVGPSMYALAAALYDKLSADGSLWTLPEYFDLDSSPQCRGDGATEPGGGAPTSKETT